MPTNDFCFDLKRELLKLNFNVIPDGVTLFSIISPIKQNLKTHIRFNSSKFKTVYYLIESNIYYTDSKKGKSHRYLTSLNGLPSHIQLCRKYFKQLFIEWSINSKYDPPKNKKIYFVMLKFDQFNVHFRRITKPKLNYYLRVMASNRRNKIQIISDSEKFK